MNNRQKIGRNRPCPCGSGKKCKHCCGDFYQTGIMFYHNEKSVSAAVPDQIALQKPLLARVKWGVLRAEFCWQYTIRM